MNLGLFEPPPFLSNLSINCLKRIPSSFFTPFRWGSKKLTNLFDLLNPLAIISWYASFLFSATFFLYNQAGIPFVSSHFFISSRSSRSVLTRIIFGTGLNPSFHAWFLFFSKVMVRHPSPIKNQATASSEIIASPSKFVRVEVITPSSCRFGGERSLKVILRAFNYERRQVTLVSKCAIMP